MVDERGVKTVYEYDAKGNLTRLTEAFGTTVERVTEFTYDADGNRLTEKRVADSVTPEALTVMEYDPSGNGNMVKKTEAFGTADARVTDYTRDVMGNVLTKTVDGKTWTYTYYADGRLESITDPLTNLTSLTYDGRGNLESVTDAENNSTSFTYDLRDNVTGYTYTTYDDAVPPNPITHTAAMKSNPDGKPMEYTDEEGKGVSLAYDPEGRITDVVDGNNNEISFEYPEAASCASCGTVGDRPSAVVYPNTLRQEYAYDTRGRVWSEKEVLSPTEEHETITGYDNAGNITSRIDANNKKTSYKYDELGRLTKITDAKLGETVFTYDSRDNLLSLADPKGNLTKFEYDRLNRLVKETRPMLEETTYAWDLHDQLIEKIDPKNQKTKYIYDNAGRLDTVGYYAVSTDITPLKTVTLTWDKTGRLTGYNDLTTSGTITYDEAGRKLTETVNYGTFSLGYSYTYYKNGLKKTFTGPDDITYTYTYDDNNQLSGIKMPGNRSITVNSYDWLRPAEVTLPGNTKHEYTYDPLMQVDTLISKDPAGNAFVSRDYTFGAAGNVADYTGMDGTHVFTYDDVYRLLNADHPDTGSLVDEAYTYDAAGNRVTSHDVAGNWTYNFNNELESYGGVTLAYDENGNIVKGPGINPSYDYFYDIENRLVRVEDGIGGVVAEYYYDPFGRRRWKEVGGIRTYFFYSDEGLIGEYDSAGVEQKTYGYKPNSLWTTDPVFMKVGTEYYYYHNDHLGTPQMMTDQNGYIVWSADYEAFGKATVLTGALVTNNLRFPGQYLDAETGLHYNRMRYFDPNTGRYIRTDPIGFAGGDINLYGYVKSNPINWIDPWGLRDQYYCNRLLKKIQRIQKKIQQREGELRENPLNLSERCSGDVERPSLSRWGHRQLISKDKKNLAKWKARYLANCSDDPPNGAPPQGESFFDWEYWEEATGLTGAALIAYLIISEGSRIIPARNLIPIP